MDVSMTEHSKSRHFFGSGPGLAECRVPKGFSSRARVISQASESVGHGLNQTDMELVSKCLEDNSDLSW